MTGAAPVMGWRCRGERMNRLIDEHLERMVELGRADRRNGYYARWLLTELGRTCCSAEWWTSTSAGLPMRATGSRH